MSVKKVVGELNITSGELTVESAIVTEMERLKGVTLLESGSENYPNSVGQKAYYNGQIKLQGSEPLNAFLNWRENWRDSEQLLQHTLYRYLKQNLLVFHAT